MTEVSARPSTVPSATPSFWAIKVLSTTVGETAADFLASTLNLGLPLTSAIMLGVLLLALAWQFSLRRYVPAVYWFAVVAMSIVGTLITDNLTDGLGVPLELSTTVFAVALALVFLIWWRTERTLSIHSITTVRRQAFYWLAILLAFALGTAAGDLVAERIDLGYGWSVVVFLAALGVVAALYFFFSLNAVTGFWIAYVLTRPLGASIGDFLSQSTKNGGLGAGSELTSVVFLALIVSLVLTTTLRARRIAA